MLNKIVLMLSDTQISICDQNTTARQGSNLDLGWKTAQLLAGLCNTEYLIGDSLSFRELIHFGQNLMWICHFLATAMIALISLTTA